MASRPRRIAWARKYSLPCVCAQAININVRLIGGPGNQLFDYYIGAALAAKQGTTPRLVTLWMRHGITDHGIEILQFDLPGEWIDNESLRAKIAAPSTLPARAGAKASLL